MLDFSDVITWSWTSVTCMIHGILPLDQVFTSNIKTSAISVNIFVNQMITNLYRRRNFWLNKNRKGAATSIGGIVTVTVSALFNHSNVDQWQIISQYSVCGKLTFFLIHRSLHNHCRSTLMILECWNVESWDLCIPYLT